MVNYKPVEKPEVKYTKLFINNEWVDAVNGKTFESINPATEEVLATFEEGDSDDIDRAVKAAKAAFERGSEYRNMDASKRGQLLFKLAELLERDLEVVATLLSLDSGKPFSSAVGSVKSSIALLQYNGGAADKLQGQTIPANGNLMAYTIYEPVGVVGAITPWNYPLLMDISKIAPAIAAGCTIVLKPSEVTPLISLQNASLIKEAGFPPGVINIVTGMGATAGAALTNHPDVDKITFTGSINVGRMIQRASADSNLKKVTLELGGKAPYIICKSADLKMAARLSLIASFANAGQVCIALTRTFVHEDVYDEFIDIVKIMASNFKVGSQFEEDVFLGPLVSDAQLKRVLNYVHKGIEEGAKVEVGGKREGEKGYFVQPTIFSNVTDNMTIAKEEIFGPVQSVLKFSNTEEALRRANDTSYGLSAAIFTNDLDEALTLSSKLQAGQVYVNGFANGGPHVPFGGYKLSGIGRERGLDGIMPYTETKAVTITTSSKIM